MNLGFIAFGVITAALVSGAAIFCAKRRAYTQYLALIGILAIAAIAISAAVRPSYYSTGKAIFVAFLMFLPLTVLYCFMPGLLVRKAASPKVVLVLTFLVTAIAVPVWLMYGLYIVCFVGQDCI
jgi:hypothetical protein